MNVPVMEKLHVKRLEENNIVIEDRFVEENNGIRKTLIRSTDGLKDDNIINCQKIEKRYFHNGKRIYKEKKFDPRARYTFYMGGTDEDEITCPNCGNKAQKSKFFQGCPFCGTNFNIDYDLKDYGKATIFIMMNKKQFYLLMFILFLIITGIIFAWAFTDPEFSKESFILIIMMCLPLSCFIFILMYFLICIFMFIPMNIYQIQKNINQKEIWYKIKRFGINVKPERFYNNLNVELLNYYYDENKAPEYKNLIDFDILKYNMFKLYRPIPSEVNIIVEYTIRKIYFSNNKIHKSVTKSTVRLKRNNVVDLLENGYKVIKCINCGATVDITSKECKYCHTPNDFKNEWTIEEFIIDKK